MRQIRVDDAVPESEASLRLIEKVRWFVREHLDEEERVLFGALVAPGIAAAYRDAGTEVEGFVITEWAPGVIPEALARGLRDKGIRVTGINP
jgi:hypothetical protein